ncbi:MAG: hypothetical protein WCJ60_02870 [bacterium]
MSSNIESIPVGEVQQNYEQFINIDTGLDLRITEISMKEITSLTIVESLISRHIMPESIKPAKNFTSTMLQKALSDAFHKHVAWNMPETATAHIAGSPEGLAVTYEIISNTARKILSLDYSYYLNPDFKRAGKLIPSVGRKILGKPRISKTQPSEDQVNSGLISARPKSELARALQNGTISTLY